MPQEMKRLRKVFEDINAILDTAHASLEASSEAHVLWDLLTALRGPDDASIAVKLATTARIRAYLVPAAEKIGADVSETHCPDINLINPGNHFGGHIVKATHALLTAGYLKG